MVLARLKICFLVDDAPVAYPVDISTYEDFSLSLLFLWGTDLEGDPLTFHVIDGPSHGTVTGTWPDMIYTPATNYFGLDSFTFVADDGGRSVRRRRQPSQCGLSTMRPCRRRSRSRCWRTPAPTSFSAAPT